MDPQKIGIAGLSLGGTTAIFTAALDERISMVLAAGGLRTFKGSLLDYNLCSCDFFPRMGLFAEMWDIGALLAPRPVCFINGLHDTAYAIQPARRAFEQIQKVYALYGAENECIMDECDQGHEWNGTVAYPFMQQHFFN